MKTIKVFTLLLITIFITGCPEGDDKYDIVGQIKIYNNSSKDIIYLNWYNSYQNYDTLLRETEIEWEWDKHTIKTDSFALETILRYQLPIEDSNEILMFYFLDPDTLLLVPWVRIARENIILKRIDIHSFTELEELNWTIAYP